MRTEVPVLRRCCFCLPLRPGLLAWAYLKLIFFLLLSTAMVFELVFMFQHLRYFTAYDWIRSTIEIIVRICSVAFTVLLIVASHKKCPRLLRTTYKCELVIAVANFVSLIAFAIYDWVALYFIPHVIRYIGITVLIGLIYTGLQLYVIVLIRSEVIKLESKHEFRFVNNAAEAECEYYNSAPPKYEDVTELNNVEVHKSSDMKDCDAERDIESN